MILTVPRRGAIWLLSDDEPRGTPDSEHVIGQHGMYWGHKGPCTHGEALRKPGMLITQEFLLKGGRKEN